jgi:hypothetical protein
MKFELSRDDAHFLRDQLMQHIHALQVEVAHTEKHELQHSIGADLGRLQQIVESLQKQLLES